MIMLLSIALFIALIFILVDRFTAWLLKHGGITIRIVEVEDADE